MMVVKVVPIILTTRKKKKIKPRFYNALHTRVLSYKTYQRGITHPQKEVEPRTEFLRASLVPAGALSHGSPVLSLGGCAQAPLDLDRFS